MRHFITITLIAFLLAIHFPAFGAVIVDPPQPTDPTKPATAVWVEGTWVVTGNRRAWEPAHWQVEQNGTSATVEAQLVAQQPVETRVVYVQAEQPAVVYAAPMVPRQVNIYAGLHAGYGVNYQVPVYQAQCTSGYYLNGQYPQGNCYNAGYYRPAAPGTTPCNYSPYSAGIVLRRPGRGY